MHYLSTVFLWAIGEKRSEGMVRAYMEKNYFIERHLPQNEKKNGARDAPVVEAERKKDR
jgi:hypothetical protein